MTEKLPDVLLPNLKIVFCGTAAGNRSAASGAYYAQPGNRFWSTLAKVGLTSRLLQPHEFLELANFGIGLTDLVKKASGIDTSLADSDYDIGSFAERMAQFAPKIIAFNGKGAAARFLERRTGKIPNGFQIERVGESRIFVLPSTSGLASRHWQIEPWQELAQAASMLCY
jgi:TDG/mug DNA glycosylase family protein